MHHLSSDHEEANTRMEYLQAKTMQQTVGHAILNLENKPTETIDYWMRVPTIPGAYMQLISCACKGKCVSVKCKCSTTSLKFTTVVDVVPFTAKSYILLLKIIAKYLSLSSATLTICDYNDRNAAVVHNFAMSGENLISCFQPGMT